MISCLLPKEEEEDDDSDDYDSDEDEQDSDDDEYDDEPRGRRSKPSITFFTAVRLAKILRMNCYVIVIKGLVHI